MSGRERKFGSIKPVARTVENQKQLQQIQYNIPGEGNIVMWRTRFVFLAFIESSMNEKVCIQILDIL